MEIICFLFLGHNLCFPEQILPFICDGDSDITLDYIGDVNIDKVRHDARKVVGTQSKRPLSASSNSSALSGDKFIPVSFVRRKIRSWREILGYQNTFKYSDNKKSRKNICEMTSGWDIIVPSAWSRAVWKALQYGGARAIGLEEAEYYSLECGMASFPRDYPDSSAGAEYWQDRKNTIEEKIRKYPQRGTPYCKNLLGSVPDFSALFRADTTETIESSVTVIRSAEFLRPFVPISHSVPAKKKPYWKSLLTTRNTKDSMDTNISNKIAKFPFPSTPFPTLVYTFLNVKGRGVLREGAAIYCPKLDDLSMWFMHNENKRAICNGGRRQGYWRGIIPTNDDRVLFGYVTTGSSSFVHGSSIGIACCEAINLYNCFALFLSFQSVQSEPIILFRNPGSPWLRPAELKLMTTEN